MVLSLGGRQVEINSKLLETELNALEPLFHRYSNSSLALKMMCANVE